MRRFFIISCFFIFLSIILQKGGFIHPEIEFYMPAYLSDKPLLNIIYDSKTLDMDNYQARELSYFFDFLDNKFISFCTHFGFPHFLSITFYIFSLLIAFEIYRFSLDDLNLGNWISICLVTLFWTASSMFFSGLLFRSAKIGVSLLLTYEYILIFRLIQNKEEINKWSMLKIFLISTAMSLFDRQGFYLSFTALTFVILWGFLKQWGKIWLAIPLIVSIIVNILYNYLIGPLITFQLNRYFPSFNFQTIDFTDFFQKPGYYIFNGVSLFIDNLRFLFGNIPGFLALGILIFLFLYIIFFLHDYKVAVILTAMISLILIMIIIMVIRHPPLVTNGIGYYWMPTTILILLAGANFMIKLKDQPIFYSRLIALLLIFCIIGNCLPIPQTCHERHNDNKMYEDAFLVIQALRMKEKKVISGVKYLPVYRTLRAYKDDDQQSPLIIMTIKLDKRLQPYICQ